MNVTLSDIDWSLVQAYLAVANTGSLSEAARQLGTSQPTVGRQVQALEAQLGATLFERRPRGMALSVAGAELLGPAETMADAAQKLSLAAAGHDAGLSGTVRITASVFTAQHHMPGIIADIREEAPDIQIELVANDATENLLFREADIAVRMYRPLQLDMVARHLGDVELGLYVAERYAKRKGVPESPDQIFDFDVIGYDRSELILRGMREAGWEVNREDFSTRCDSHPAYFELIRAGAGLGFAQVSVADATPGMIRLFPDMPLPKLPIWLTAHPTIRRLPRVAKVWDALAFGLSETLLPP